MGNMQCSSITCDKTVNALETISCFIIENSNTNQEKS